MPDRAPHACPGCGATTSEKGRCANCRSARNRAIDERRGSSAERGYDADWKRVRDSFLATNPLCAFCHERNVVTLAEVVDHIVPIAQSPRDRLDPRNLRSLCKMHHDQHTATEQSFGRGDA